MKMQHEEIFHVISCRLFNPIQARLFYRLKVQDPPHDLRNH